MVSLYRKIKVFKLIKCIIHSSVINEFYSKFNFSNFVKFFNPKFVMFQFRHKFRLFKLISFSIHLSVIPLFSCRLSFSKLINFSKQRSFI